MPSAKKKQDPAIAAFLALLAQDIVDSPQDIRPLDEQQMTRIVRLTKDVQADPQEDFGDSPLRWTRVNE